MKTLENDPIGDRLALPVEIIHPVFAIALGYKIDGTWRFGHVSRSENVSLFYNAALYVRVLFPCWLGIQIRWAGSNPLAKEYFQTGLGWALNGRLKALFRIQSDEASAQGVSGPNVGQAIGWQYGTK